MNNIVLQIIGVLINQKKEANIIPSYITHKELLAAINASLNALYKDKSIAIGKTINDKYITINNNRDA